MRYAQVELRVIIIPCLTYIGFRFTLRYVSFQAPPFFGRKRLITLKIRKGNTSVCNH